jgi:6-phosphogluconolactonase
MPSSTRLVTALLILGAWIVPSASWAGAAASKGDYFVYVGSYTRKTSKGVYGFRFNATSGKLTTLGLVAEIPSPSSIAVNPNGRFLYTANEREYNEMMGNKVSTFAINQETGALTLLKRTPSGGDGPAHILIDPAGKVAIVNNYRGGNVAVLPIQPDGTLIEATTVDQHYGHGGNAKRQPSPHPHHAILTADNKFVLTTDNGTDQVMVYRFDVAKGTIVPNNPPSFKEKPADAPWHIALHPNGKFAYVTNEIPSTMTALAFSEADGTLRELQTLSTVPEGVEGNEPSEIRVDKQGKFLYVANRGQDNIGIFAIDQAKGTLTLVEYVPTGGKTPRNIAFDPSGGFMLVGNQFSNTLVAFKVDSKTGHLTSTGQVLDTQEPTSIVFVPVKAAH